ncbi:hypothetical protein [Subdoligranulum variabile]|uniref:hypothetical protein n=1 Tax=Subdoligranulum variabile TaxID=214851 RepID=UPI0026EB49C1|nr:hypothetical protein [Subdoligranulum variabile]
MGLTSVGGGTGGGQYKNLVPPLTSTSKNGYKVSASSVYSSMTQDDVVKCFDRKTEDAVWNVDDYRDRIFLNYRNTNQTITVELPQAKEARMIVVLYTSTFKDGVGRAKAISVSGSNDGARYTPLTGYAPYNCGSVFMRSEVDTTKYKYYKIDMTRESEYIGIIEVMLLGK